MLRRLPRHSHIISLLDAFRDENSPNLLLLVLEFADAGDLAGFLLAGLDTADGIDGESRQHRRKLSLQLFTQVVEGVAFLHKRNVLHRDLKPQNVLLFRSAPASGDLRAVVGDFGSSKTLSSTAALAQTVVGSPLYMSPELLESEPHGTPTDIWSLGCLLYEVLAGQPPFRAPSYPAVVRKITRGEYLPLTVEHSGDKKVGDLVNWMLQRDPSKRPTADEVLASLASSAVLGSDQVSVAEFKGSSASSTTSDATTVTDNHEECNGVDDVTIMPPPAPVPRQPVQVSPPEADGITEGNSEDAQVAGHVSITSLPPQEQQTDVLTLPPGKLAAEVRSNEPKQQRARVPLHPTQRNSHRVDTPEMLSLPPPPARGRTPALRPSFLPKASSVHASTTRAPRTATTITKHRPIVDSSNSDRTATTVSELLVVGVRVTSKRTPAASKPTKSLHGK